MKASCTARRNRGMSLPVVLMFLIVISLVATLGIRRATIGEALSRNQIELETARQAAEAALRDGERDLMLPTGLLRTGALCARNTDRPLVENLGAPAFTNACPRGQCLMGDMTYYDTSNYGSGANPHPWWPSNRGGLWNETDPKPSDAAGAGANCNFTGAVPLGTFTGTPRLPIVARQPEYIIERMKRGEDTFMRVTARGFGADIRTEVVVQSYFRPFLD